MMGYLSTGLSVVLQFSLRLPYKEEIVITYLQPGVEYCVTVSVNSGLNSNPVSSDPYCAFTSPPPPRSSCTSLLFYYHTPQTVAIQTCANFFVLLCNHFESIDFGDEDIHCSPSTEELLIQYMHIIIKQDGRFTCWAHV